MQYSEIKNYAKAVSIKKYFDYFIVVLAFLLGLSRHWDYPDILPFCFLIWIILNPLSSKQLIKLAFLIFGAAIIYLLANGNSQMNHLMEILYYVLFLAGVMFVTELREKKQAK